MNPKFLLILALALVGTSHVYAQDSDTFPSFEEMRQEAREFNKTVTEEEMVEFFELIYKYHPKNIADFRSQSPEERTAFLAEYRQAANEAGMKLSTLRGLSEEELRQMDELAKWDAEEAILAEEAWGRLNKHSSAEHRVILEEAKMLIGSFDSASADRVGRQILTDQFPEGLAFVEPDVIYVGDDWCDIYLQRRLKKGIGYTVRQSDSGEWSIAWFNEYAAWERNPIELDHHEHAVTNSATED